MKVPRIFLGTSAKSYVINSNNINNPNDYIGATFTLNNAGTELTVVLHSLGTGTNNFSIGRVAAK